MRILFKLLVYGQSKVMAADAPQAAAAAARLSSDLSRAGPGPGGLDRETCTCGRQKPYKAKA